MSGQGAGKLPRLLPIGLSLAFQALFADIAHPRDKQSEPRTQVSGQGAGPQASAPALSGYVQQAGDIASSFNAGNPNPRDKCRLGLTYTGTMRKVETRVRVRYAETDQMGVVYYANYLVWMEVGRVAYCSQAGFEYRDMEREDGAILAVTEARCRYLAPARFDDEVRITTWVKEARSRTLRFAYEMRRDTEDRLLATGETLHIVCDREGRTIRLPEKYRQYFPLTTEAPANLSR